MSDQRRLFVEPGELAGDDVVISGPEAHHALKVLRMQPGDKVTLLDGHGVEAEGAVGMTTRRDLVVAIESRREHPAPPFEIVLLQAWIHRDKALEELIRRGAEVGIRRFVFFAAERSERTPKLSDKWPRWAIDACKQCGRPWLPEFACVPKLADALAHAKGALCLLSLHAEPKPLSSVLTGGDATLLVGPEGDFTPAEEAAAAQAGATPISLGSTIYRAEAAAVLAAALVQYEQGGLGPRDPSSESKRV